MKVHVDPDDIQQGTTDDRGRIYLGPEYKNETVEIAILESEGES